MNGWHVSLVTLDPVYINKLLGRSEGVAVVNTNNKKSFQPCYFIFIAIAFVIIAALIVARRKAKL